MTESTHQQPQQDQEGQGGGEISLLRVVTILLRHRWVLVVCTLGVACLIGLIAVLDEQKYTARASFLPQDSEGSGGLGRAAALAGQLGIAIPTAEAGHSPEFYADLLKSRELLSPLLTDTFSIRSEDGQTRREGTLLEIVDIRPGSQALRREYGIRWLDNVVSVRHSPATGVVEMRVTTEWPELSFGISTRLLDLLNDFNLRQRQSHATAERTFIEDRLLEARRSLLEAEDSLKIFLEQNRQFENSPQLRFEHDRLQRQVMMRQQVFTSLNQSYEEARISEVRTTPVITVVQRPEVPPTTDPRNLRMKVLLGLLLGVVVGVLVAFTRELLRTRRQQGNEDYREFRGLWRETIDDFRRPFRGLFGGGAGLP